MPDLRSTPSTLPGLAGISRVAAPSAAAIADPVRSIALAVAAREALPILIFTGLTALAGQLRVPLPFTPVPLTLQVIPVLVAGALMGPARGSGSQFLLLAAGAGGLPVFAGGGSGLAYLSGPTGGYLIGFMAAALLVGALLRGRGAPGFGRVLLAMSAGAAVIHALGILHLTVYTGGSLARAFELGSLPFLPGEGLKLFAAASIAFGWLRVRGPKG